LANSLVYDLSMLVRRMAHRLLISRKYVEQDSKLAHQGLDFLKRNGLDGSVLRGKEETNGTSR